MGQGMSNKKPAGAGLWFVNFKLNSEAYCNRFGHQLLKSFLVLSPLPSKYRDAFPNAHLATPERLKRVLHLLLIHTHPFVYSPQATRPIEMLWW
jgi:hypothetical protein